MPISPGGRPISYAHHNLSPKKNWVENSGAGELPQYIRGVRNSLVAKRGMTESHATAVAILMMKKWSHGGGNVRPAVQAAAAKAVVEWEALKAFAKGKR